MAAKSVSSHKHIRRQLTQHDLAIEIVMGVLLVFMPLAFGAVEAWSHLVVTVAIGLMALLLALRTWFHPEIKLHFTWGYVPPILFVGLVLAQLLPMPANVLAIISPETADMYRRLWSDMPDATQLSQLLTLSYYPAETRRILHLAILAVLVFVVVVNVYRTSYQIKRLLWIITWIAGAAALLMILQVVVGNDGLQYQPWPWSGPGKAKFSFFINYNNFSQYMNLSMGATLGLFLLKLHEELGHGRVQPNTVVLYFRRPESHGVKILLLFFVLGLTSVFLSSSRGGMVSLMLAFALTVLSLARLRKMKAASWSMLVIGIFVLVAILYLGFDQIYARLETLSDIKNASGARWQTNIDVLGQLFPKHPWLGVGLGAHEVVFPSVSRVLIPANIAHVENEYVQVLEEAGLVGFILLAGFFALVGIKYWQATKLSNTWKLRTVAYGLGFGLVAVLIHSLSDFGQRIPAVFVLTATSAGLIVSLARRRSLPASGETDQGEEDELNTTATRQHTKRILALILALSITVYIGYECYQLFRDSMAQNAWRYSLGTQTRLKKTGWQTGSDADYRVLTESGQKAVDWAPDYVLYRYCNAMFQWYKVARNIDYAVDITVDREEVKRTAESVVAQMQDVRRVCPTYGMAFSFQGQLEAFILRQQIGATHIRQGFELARSHPVTVYTAGLLDAQEGRWQEALDKFKHAKRLGYPYRELLDVLINKYDQPELAYKLSENDYAALLETAQLIRNSKANGEIGLKARKEAINLIMQAAGDQSPDAIVLAEAGKSLVADNELDKGITMYQRALLQKPDSTTWRYALAEALMRAQRNEEAISEARVVLRTNPDHMQARALIVKLSGVRTNEPTTEMNDSPDIRK